MALEPVVALDAPTKLLGRAGSDLLYVAQQGGAVVAFDPEAADGLRPGDLVVATGVHRLRDGELVKVAE